MGRCKMNGMNDRNGLNSTGDMTGQEALYTEYREKVTRYVIGKLGNRDDAEDVVSEVFFKVYEGYPTYHAERASVSTWIYTITRNTVIDYFRTHRRHAELTENIADGGCIDDGILREESLQELAAALRMLDERSRALIVLRYYKKLPLKEIAQRMGISYAYVKILHKRALHNLRTRMNT